MCGRYALAIPVNELQRLFGFVELPSLPPSYNVAPTQPAPVVRRRRDEPGRELALLRWSLIPPWSEGPATGYSTINARAETVAIEPACRRAFRQQRCLVPDLTALPRRPACAAFAGKARSQLSHRL